LQQKENNTQSAMSRVFINSLQNSLVKQVVKLSEKSQERKKTGWFVAEGRREVSLALQAGVGLQKLFICEELFVEDKHYPIPLEGIWGKIVYVSTQIYAKMAYRGSAEGIIAILETFQTHLDHLVPSENPLYLILESVEKPGNLGAVLRTADASGADAVIICDPQTDVFNPNVIRSSLGCIFTVGVAVCSSQSWFDWAAKNGIVTCIASVQADNPYYNADMRQPVALAFGSEANGLSDIWYVKSAVQLKIPMAGKIDSLNVAASAAIMVFEARRQRNVLGAP
jgi:RNA methyltransferase, TrmH family